MEKYTLKKAREQLGLPQDMAAFIIGVTSTTLRRWERGESTPTLEGFWKLCKLYGVEPDKICLMERI